MTCDVMGYALPPHSRWGERGFTLIELLIVLVIISMLASFGVTQYGRYVRKADAAGAAQHAALIDSAIRGYADSRPTMSLTTFVNSVNNTYSSLSDGCASGCLTTLVPQVKLKSGHDWSYTIAVVADTDSRHVYSCIKASKDTYSIYYSTVPSTSEGWDSNVYTRGYIEQDDESFTAGGSCSSSTPAATLP